jgi:DNA-binding transcriptional regulator YiaG
MKKKTAIKRLRLRARVAASLLEMRAIARGEALPSRVWEVKSDGKGGFTRRQIDPAEHCASLRRRGLLLDPLNEVVAARVTLELTREEFAEMLRVSVRTLRDWELGRRKPHRIAQLLFRVAASRPKAVLKAARLWRGAARSAPKRV